MVDYVNILGQITQSLRNDSAVKGYLGKKIYLLDAPTDEHEAMMPYAVLSMINSTARNTSEIATGAELTMTIDVWSAFKNGPAACLRIGAAIEDVLNVWSNDAYGVIPATRSTSTNLFSVDGAWCQKTTYRFLINGG